MRTLHTIFTLLYLPISAFSRADTLYDATGFKVGLFFSMALVAFDVEKVEC